METIKGNVSNLTKRLYTDITISAECPHCNNLMTARLDDSPLGQYLLYPKAGEIQNIYLCCKGCEREYNLPIEVAKMQIVLEFDKDDIEEQ